MTKETIKKVKDLLDIVKYIRLDGKKINETSTYLTSKDSYPCDCGCEQDGEGFCMDC